MNVAEVHASLLASELPLDRLAANPNIPEQEKVAEVCRQFEAVLLRQILQQARKTVIDSEFNSESATSGIYQDMVTNQLAESISRSGGLGLAQSLQAQLTRQMIKPDGASTLSQSQTPPLTASNTERHE